MEHTENNIYNLIYNFLNKIILIKSFLTGVLYDRLKLIYPCLKEGDKVCECYS